MRSLLARLDLNLLRLLDAVHRTRSVSRAAEALGITQPAASQGLTRLRLALHDPLFVRAPGGVRPTPRAEQLAGAVRDALALLGAALEPGERFEPAASRRLFRLHLSDIGEARFLPELLAMLAREAPQVRLASQAWPHGEIAAGLDDGRLDLALGFLPGLQGVRSRAVLRDRYGVLLRRGHALAPRGPRALRLSELRRLEFAAVRTHAETLRILQQLRLEDRLRLTADHSLALPAIVEATDLAVLMPRDIAERLHHPSRHVIADAELPAREFAVSLHWSVRHEADPAGAWLRGRIMELFGTRRAESDPGTRRAEPDPRPA